MFLWIALAGTQRAALNTDPTLSLLGDFYVCLVFGLSLAVCAWAFYRISGGLFNPAVRSPFSLFFPRSATSYFPSLDLK